MTWNFFSRLKRMLLLFPEALESILKCNSYLPIIQGKVVIIIEHQIQNFAQVQQNLICSNIVLCLSGHNKKGASSYLTCVIVLWSLVFNEPVNSEAQIYNNSGNFLCISIKIIEQEAFSMPSSLPFSTLPPLIKFMSK